MKETKLSLNVKFRKQEAEMSFWKMLDKLDDIIYKPIEMITDWAKEPLRRWEYKRKEEEADNQLKREILMILN